MAYKGKYFAPSDRETIRLGSWMMRLVAVLICILLVSFHLMTGLYAKYSSTATGSDSARVAKFQVVVTGDAANISVACTQMPGNEAAYEITVENASEVAVKYDVIVTLSAAVPGVTLTLDGIPGAQIDSDPKRLKFENLGQFTPNDSTVKEHTLTFQVNWNLFTAEQTGSTAEENFTFSITVHAEQVD